MPLPGVPGGPRNGGAGRMPGSESAGYHGDLSVPNPNPKTPVTAPSEAQAATQPAEIGTSTAGADYHRAVAHLPRRARTVTLAALHNPIPPTEVAKTPTTSTQDLATLLGGALGTAASDPLAALLGGASSIDKPFSAGATSPAISDSPFTADQLESHTPDAEELHHQEIVEKEGIQNGAKIENLYGPTRYGGPATTPTSRPATQPNNAAASTAVISSRGGARPAAAAPVDANDPLGAKTLGDVTQGQLEHAAKAGTLKIHDGILTTPTGRADLRQVAQAKKAVAQSGPDIAALHQAYPELSTSVLKSYADAARRTGVPPQLLAGIEEQESNYGQSTLPGVHSGANSAGAAGPFQIGNDPSSAAGDAWQGLAQELWGDQADQHSIYNQHDAAVAAGQYLSHTYGHATSDPSTWQPAAESYNHATWYGEKAVEVAEEHAKLAKLGLPPNPTATEALQVAVKHARADGINPTPFNGDVEGGSGSTVWVRADAKGMIHWAESATGTVEGSAKAERWGQKFGLNTVSQPWCANFTSNGLLRRGFSEGELPANPNYVPSFEEWAKEGKYASVVQGGLAHAKPGDLLAFEGEHIGIYKGNDEMISGNSGNAVSVTSAEDGGLGVMVIRPNYKGGKVEVPVGANLPGSTSESALGGSTGTSTGTTVAATSGGGTGGATTTSRPAATAPELVALTNPFSLGPTLPQVATPEVEGGESAEEMHDSLLQLLGTRAAPGAVPTGRPTLA